MHKLLIRLLRRHLAPDYEQSGIADLLKAVSRSFDQSDQDREILERSLMLTSQELNDINSRLRQQLSSLENSQRQLQETLVERSALINATPEAILSIGAEGELKQINEAGCKLMGLSETEIRSNTREQNIQSFASRLKNPEHFLKIIRKVEKDNEMVVNDSIQTTDGRFYECYSVAGILEETYVSRVWCFRDVTEARQHQELLRHQAFHDSLTGLPNRSLLIESIEHAISLAKRNSTQVSVLFIDLDDFKKINDTAGHQEGDQFLINISQQIRDVIRESDIIGRLGGDEFLVVLEGIEHQRQVINIHDRILKLFSKPYKIDESEYFVTCSIGISSYPQDGDNAEMIIRNADMAMYQAKRSGKNTFHYFDDNLARIALHRVSLESQLRQAIDQRQFIFHFQPKVCLSNRAIIGFEALIRWQKSSGELIYPDHFIPVAEDTGLIREITKIVVASACERLDAWKGTPLANIPISINISANDFSDKSFIPHLICQIDQRNVPAHLLELELTESLFFNDINQVKRSIAALKAKGLMLSIDDFGTGYSSFSYLHDLDIDFLKIDKSFVQSLFKNQKSKAIVKSIIDLGENLGIEIVAEGVESEEDHDFLKHDGCHIAQGYHYSRPIPEDELFKIVSQKKPGNL